MWLCVCPGAGRKGRSWQWLVYLKYGGSHHHHLSWSKFGRLPDIAYKVVLLHRMTHWSPSTCSSDDDEVVRRREEARLMAELVKPSDSSSDSDEGEKKKKRRKHQKKGKKSKDKHKKR